MLFRTSHARSVICFLALALFLTGSHAIAQPFTVQGPGVNTNHFRVTTFASGLSFPLGMAELSDGSLLVTIVQSTGLSSGTNPGRLIRLTDTNSNGIADGAGVILYSNLSPALTAVRVVDQLVFVMGRPHPITVLRLGATPATPLTLAGRLINVKLQDLITGENYTWTQEWNYVELEPSKMPFHLFRLESHASQM